MLEACVFHSKVGLVTGIAEDDDHSPGISWRGDGQFFAVSSVTNQGNVVVKRL